MQNRCGRYLTVRNVWTARIFLRADESEYCPGTVWEFLVADHAVMESNGNVPTRIRRHQIRQKKSMLKLSIRKIQQPTGCEDKRFKELPRWVPRRQYLDGKRCIHDGGYCPGGTNISVTAMAGYWRVPNT